MAPATAASGHLVSSRRRIILLARTSVTGPIRRSEERRCRGRAWWCRACPFSPPSPWRRSKDRASTSSPIGAASRPRSPPRCRSRPRRPRRRRSFRPTIGSSPRSKQTTEDRALLFIPSSPVAKRPRRLLPPHVRPRARTRRARCKTGACPALSVQENDHQVGYRKCGSHKEENRHDPHDMIPRSANSPIGVFSCKEGDNKAVWE